MPYTYDQRNAIRAVHQYQCVITGAADVAVSGFTVTDRAGTSITAVRSAEGLITVTLPRGYPYIFAVASLDDGIVDLHVKRDTGADVHASGVIGLRTHTAAGVDTDADSCNITLIAIGHEGGTL